VSIPLLTTKLYIPPIRPLQSMVVRPRLIERLNEGLRSGRMLTLVSAPAGVHSRTQAVARSQELGLLPGRWG
jgi:LuxR family maltose regulon positive regulatory protein